MGGVQLLGCHRGGGEEGEGEGEAPPQGVVTLSTTPAVVALSGCSGGVILVMAALVVEATSSTGDVTLELLLLLPLLLLLALW